MAQIGSVWAQPSFADDVWGVGTWANQALQDWMMIGTMSEPAPRCVVMDASRAVTFADPSSAPTFRNPSVTPTITEPEAG